MAERNRAYLQASYHYDPAGRLLDRILSNRARTNYKYDDNNRLTQLTNVSAGDGLNETQTYSYDNTGNITGLTDASGPAIFVYDPLYRLTSADYPGTADDVSYTYDGVGNRLTETKGGQTYAYVFNNDGNRLDEVRQGSDTGPVVYRFFYDNNGNRIEKRDGADAVLQSYQYDQKNRVATLITQTDTHYFDYDPNDYRISRLNSGGTKVHLLEGEHLEAVYDGSGQIEAKYLRGVVVDEIVNGYYYDEQGKKTNYTFHHDHLRSVVGLTAHEGSTVETSKYGAFGEEIASTGTSENFLKYTGRELDEELGLYYYRARYYDPEVGRFLSEDPLGFEAGMNFYSYCQNNPINLNDPMGLEPGDFFDLNNWSKSRGEAIAGQVLAEAQELAIQMANGDINKANLLLRNGQVDAWRHVEWQRRTAEEMNSTFAWLAGTQHEIKNLTDWVGEWWNGTNELSLTQQLQENFMDLSNNFVGRNAAENGVTRMSYNNPLLTFGLGGISGQPDAGFLSYSAVQALSSISVADPSLLGSGSAGGGFVIYPNKPNTNMMQTVYSK